VAYVRATFAVAVVDAVGVGIGLFVLGIPLAVPLSALVFLAAFIPIIGALLAGTAAVLIALVANGVVPALILLGIVIAVMQLESHVLQPLLLGRAVKLHPLAVVLAIATGLLTAGIAGALLAVPLLAVLNSGIRSLRSKAEHLDPAEVHASEPEESGPDEAGLDTEAGPKNTTEQSPVPPATRGPARTPLPTRDEPGGSNGCSWLQSPPARVGGRRIPPPPRHFKHICDITLISRNGGGSAGRGGTVKTTPRVSALARVHACGAQPILRRADMRQQIHVIVERKYSPWLSRRTPRATRSSDPPAPRGQQAHRTSEA
jgi:hypothetical protein